MLQEQGTPLIAPIAGDAAHVLVTFLWRATDEIENVVVIGDLVGNVHWCDSFAASALARLPATNLYYRTYQIASDARFTYRLSVNQRLPDPRDWHSYSLGWRADPLNPRPFAFAGDEHDPNSSAPVLSVVELPTAPAQPWITPHAPGPGGRVQFHPLPSTVLESDYRVWVYTPAGYGPSSDPYPLLLLFDGESYLRAVPAPVVLDNLIAAGRLPPLVALLLETRHCNRVLALYPPFLDFLVQEVDPWIYEHYRVTADPARRIVGGLSLGGLTALYAGLRHPDLFGNVLSQSGGLFWAPQDDAEPVWLARQFATGPRLPLRLYLEVGSMEREATINAGPSQLSAHRHLRDVLRAKG